jgi:SPP1 gp7 family putative phage head morphogenesis protein
MTEFLWQHFVFDGTPVYPRYNLGKQIIGFEIIDAPTIKVLLDNRGSVPATPAPAYQQILWGFPRGEYQSSPESDGEFFNAPGKNNEYMRDQLAYFVRNRRTWSPYGYSCVEEAIPSATLYLERQQWMKSEYQDGTMPMAFMETDSDEMDITRLAAFERVFNDRLVGSNAERHRMKVLPRGFKPVFAPTIDERYKENYDNFLILRIATIFGVAPSALGIIPRSGLGGAGEREGEAQSALTTSQKPLESFLVETINTLSRRFLGTDKNITFAFDDDDDNVAALETKSKAYQVSLASGQMTMNDVRGELGMPLYDMPEADEPFIVAGNSIQFFNGLLEQSATGETIGMKENINGNQETQIQKPQEGESSQSPQSEHQAQPTEAGVEQKSVYAEEMHEFARFIKSRNKTGKWRAFDFVTVNEEIADKLNSDAYFIVKGTSPMPENLIEWATSITKAQITDNPKGLVTKRSIADLPGIEHKLQIEEHYTPQIMKAIADNISGIDEAIAQAMSTEKKISADAKSKIKFDVRPLKKIITNTLLDGGLVGSAYAVRQLDKYGATGVSQLSKAALEFDWANWKPGNPIAASLVTDGKLRKTLKTINLTITGIKGTTIDRIGNLIGDGVAQGLPAKEIGKTINDFVNDPARAEMIAITETNRAYNEGAVDQYSQFGVSEWDWVAYDDACIDCLSIQDGSPYSTNDSQLVPPEHPNCRCTVNAVISTS